MNDVAICRIDAEQSVLGALLLDNTAVAKVSDWLGADDFYRRDHAVMYSAICALIAAGTPVDAITLAETVAMEGGPLDASYVLNLSSNTPSAANVTAYAEIVVELSRMRQAIDVAHSIIGAAQTKGVSSRDLVASAQAALAGLAFERVGGLQPVKNAVGEFYRDLAARYESQVKFSGRLTPWRDVNDLTLGLKPADLIVIAGRPGMGKSVAGFGLATFDAMRGGRPAIFSLEMSSAQFVEREVAALGEIPHEWLRDPDKNAKDKDGGFASDTYWARTSRAMQELVGSKLLIDDTPSLTIDQIIARAKRAHLQAPLTMVVIDHLHIVRIKGGDNIVNQLGDVSRGAKRLAKELRCPVVLLAQLNRGNEQRTDKRPNMADLRGSGEIEQDADYILLLHRDDYYDENAPTAGMMELIVGKARHAKKRTIHLKNRLDQMRFEDWTGEVLQVPSVRDLPPRGMPTGRSLRLGRDA